MAAKKRIAIGDRPPITFGEYIPDIAPEPTEAERWVKFCSDLAEDIGRLKSTMNQYLADRTIREKQSRDGAGLPPGVLMQMLAKGETCTCDIVTRLLRDE